ncbi:MAG: NUDIX domain-containing protein [Streptosporangiaceae bacterium]
MPERSGSPGKTIRAAGAVVWRPGPGGPEIALVHRPRYDDWSLPKGKRHRDEHVLTTVTREVAEETGLRIALGRPLSTSSYLAEGRPKQVRYWVARSTDSAGFAPGPEVDRLAWVRADEAADVLTYPRDVVLLKEFTAAPVRTAPLILLRHSAAGHKGSAGANDLARPLDASGSADARCLAGLLACYGQCRVLSSAAERCVATVRPYAKAIGVPVETERALTVGADQPPAGEGPGSSTNSIPLVAAAQVGVLVTELVRSETPAVICAHRENLPALAGAACAALGAPGLDGRPLRKGAFWVLHAAGGSLLGAERHDCRG